MVLSERVRQGVRLGAGALSASSTRDSQHWSQHPRQAGDQLASHMEGVVATKNTHVVPNPTGGWDIKQSGATRSSGHFRTKREAVGRAREISRKRRSELVIHNKDGRISQKDSHGRDPRSIRG